MKSNINLNTQESNKEDSTYRESFFEIEFPLYLKDKKSERFMMFTPWGKACQLTINKTDKGENLNAHYTIFDACNFFEDNFDKYGLYLLAILKTNIVISEKEFMDQFPRFEFFTQSILSKYREWDLSKEEKEIHRKFFEKFKIELEKQAKNKSK